MSSLHPYPRLLADIGGTNARFALETAPGIIEDIDVLPCNDYPTLADAMRAYLQRADTRSVSHAAIGIANPVTGDFVQMTNHHWAFSIEATRQQLGFATLLVLNDFTALALALPHLPAAELAQLGGGEARHGAKALIGAGTGLGVSGLLPHGGSWVAIAGEGGHVSFAPVNDEEAAILHYAQGRLGQHVSCERFLSGPGLELIHDALAVADGEAAGQLSAAQISERGLSGRDARCEKVLAHFCAMLGTAAGNLALTLGAVGGVYIGGGIVPRFGDMFARSAFRERFEAKGRFRDYLAAVPVYVIHSAYPALTGVQAALADHLGDYHA
ncbi:glucokinase [Vogesella sp. LIG4]|uniref:glucokinase n=1 Tax=Vogesella sp. LIG4 TaxID=1192162 RepID=UPI0008201193|nr:glucokinase [Vogesella sp. LIG4]SCK11323.1 glucokinase [Vogesella sp. LIG4]